MIIASCPVCGKVLFRGAPNSQIEGSCPKCGEYLKIAYVENGFNAVALNFSAESCTEGRKPKPEKKNTIIS